MERGEGFFAAQGDAAKALEAVEEALDEVALLVERPVERRASRARRVPLDLGRGAKIVGGEAAQSISVIAGIGDDVAHAMKPREQAPRLRAVAPVPRCDLEPDRQAERIDRSVDLGGQPAARAADRVSLKPPF